MTSKEELPRLNCDNEQVTLEDMAHDLGVSQDLLLLLFSYSGITNPEFYPRRSLALLRHRVAKVLIPSIDNAISALKARGKRAEESAQLEELLDEYCRIFDCYPTFHEHVTPEEMIVLLADSIKRGTPLPEVPSSEFDPWHAMVKKMECE